MASSPTLAGRRILLVEDDFLIAEDFAASFKAAGAEVVGPVATVRDALALIARADRLDGAVLDINLQGQMADAVADALRARGVPVAFATGYDRDAIPERYADVPLCEKPVEPEQIARAFWG